MAEVKVTKKDNFTAIKAILEEQGETTLAEVMAHEIELLNKKKAETSKTAKENLSLSEVLYDALVEYGKPTTLTALQKESPSLADYSNQKLTALARVLIDNGKATKTMDKKSALYSAVVLEETEVEAE